MKTSRFMPAVLVSAGLLGLLLTGLQALAAPAWCWLVLVGGGLIHSLAWRAAGVRRVSRRERLRHEVRLRNAEKREKRHLQATLRVDRRMKKVLAEVRERPTLEWGEKVAAVVRRLQDGFATHEAVLRQQKFITDNTAERLSEMLERTDEGN